MTVQLLDGPCQGDYLVKRAPVFLRAVKKGTGETDLLDQLDDTPAKDEKVYIYHTEGIVGWVHIHGNKKVQGWWALAKYRFIPDVDGEKFRNNTAWQEWADKEWKNEKERSPLPAV